MRALSQHILLQSLLLFLVIVFANGYTDPASCTGPTKFYDILLLQCSTCPYSSSQTRAADYTYCNCTNSYYDNPAIFGFNDPQSCLAAPFTYNATQVVNVYDLSGALLSPPTVVGCANGYPDQTKTKCIPCGPDMTLDPILTCICTPPSYALNGACYTSTTGTLSQIINTPTTSEGAGDYLAQQHAVVGCLQHNLIQSCNLLINKCVNASYSSTDFFCKKLKDLQLTKSPTTGLSVYTFSGQLSDSISLYASSIIGTNLTTVKNTFKFILLEYNFDGSLNDLKALDDSIFSCYLNAEDIVRFQSFGLNFNKTCSSPRTFKVKYFYDVYVMAGDGTFSEVPILIAGSYYKRFTPALFNSIKLTFVSQPPMQVPYLSLSNASPAIIGTTSIATSTSINFLPFFVIFAVLMVIGFIINFYRYMKYNPDQNNDPYYCFKAIFLLFVYIIKYIAVTIWIWILCLSAYCFCFYKFQKTVYLILPDPSNDTSGLYKSFEAFYYVNFSLMIVAIFILMFNLTNYTDYFLIDWEKEKELGRFEIGHNRKEVSVWRKVLLVNQLYELSIGRIINIEMVSLFSLLFLQGLKWINLNSMVPNTSNLVTDNTIITNSILSYFIITFVIFAIALVQFLLRVAIKTWYPLPIENFIDLCSVSNISIIIFDEALHGYYIHGMNPLGQSQGTLSYIQSMFEKQAKAFGKSRSFKLEDIDQCQTFQVVFPYQIRQAFQVKYKSRLLQKLAGKAYNTSFFSNPIPEMLNDEDYKDLEEINTSMLESFKYYLEGVKTSMMNVRQRGFFEKIINCPVDTTMMGKLPVFFKDQWYEFSNILLSGHEFVLLFNFANFVNVFYIATANIYYAFFIAFIFEKLFNLTYGFFIKRNISKNTLIDDKFFN